MQIRVRKEATKDYDSIGRLVEEAFLTADHTDHDEQHLVARLRGSKAFVPELALVADRGESLAGYALFTEIAVGEATLLCLAPLAVHPSCQKKGIGGKLIQAGEIVAREMGYRGISILGDNAYYGRFGYVPASRFGIRPPFVAEDRFFMAKELWKGALSGVCGLVQYPPEFRL